MSINQLPPLQDVLALARKMKAAAEDCSPHPRYSDSMIAFRTECIPANVIAVVDALAAIAQQAQEPVQADAPRSCPDVCRTPEKCCNFGCQKATPPAPQVPAPVDERAEFEQWAEANVAQHHDKSDRHCMWWGWQARAAFQSPAPQTKGHP